MTQGSETTDFWEYPLIFGNTLASNDWAELRFHEFLESSFLAHALHEGRRADIGTAWILWNACYRLDPAGTLPDDDVELAKLAGFGVDVAAWQAVRAKVLVQWQPVHIANGAGRGARLGHPFIAQIAERSWSRKSGRMQGRDAARLAGIKFKVKKKLVELRRPKLAENDAVLVRVAKWLDQAGLNVTLDNVIAGLDQVGAAPVVVPFGGVSEG